MSARVAPGPLNRLTDVEGLSVGNAEDETVVTGATVILPEGEGPGGEPPGFVAAADVRGGGPGTRETDALEPEALVERVDALVLAGGSAFGLDAAGGAQAWLSARGRGFAAGDFRVPIVPAAILYDLSNGGDKDWGDPSPYRALGQRACEAADSGERAFALGRAGVGLGCVAGDRRGGLGSASAVDPETGATVAALAAVNSFGMVTMADGSYYAWPYEIGEEFGGRRPTGVPEDPTPRFPKIEQVRANTTLVAVATDAVLDRGQARRLAVMAQDGMARAIRPVHTPFDGDTVFALATGRGPSLDVLGLARLGALAADCTARAIARGVHEAQD